MQIQAQLTVDAPLETVWRIASDIEHAAERVSRIDGIEVIERPGPGLLGLKWRETRTIYGSPNTETMEIIEVEEGAHYVSETRGQGIVYQTRVEVAESEYGTRLSMRFSAEATNPWVSAISFLLGLMTRGAVRRAIIQDLLDLKTAAQARRFAVNAEPVPD